MRMGRDGLEGGGGVWSAADESGDGEDGVDVARGGRGGAMAVVTG